MIAKDLADLLMQNPDAQVTVEIMDGDNTDENPVDGVLDWGSFISIQHSRERRPL